MTQAPVRPDRVAIYIRWSTDDQGEGTTLDVQLEGCRHYALSQGWQCSPDLVFIDDGYSGGTLERPALARLREAVQQGRVDCVVVLKIDRLSRNVVDTVNLVLREWDGRCHVKSAREAIDTASQQGKMFFYTLVSFAEWERSVIKERTWSGRMKRLQEGRNPGFRPPYGLQTGETPGTFALVPAEAAVVRQIFALYGRGLGYKGIAVELSRAGLRFRAGRPWSAQAVMAVVRNPIYTGLLVYRRAGEAPVAVESAHIPRIVAADQFQQAQSLRARRAGGRAPNRAVASCHLLTGIVRCKGCGAALIGRKKYGRGQSALYYICGGQRSKGAAFCNAAYIRQEILDQWVLTRLMERYGGEAGREPFLEDAGELRGQVDAAANALTDVRRELAGLERELVVIGRDYRQERLTAEEYREQRAAVADEQARLGARAAELQGGLAQAEERNRLRQGALACLEQVQRWEQLTLAERKHVLRELIDQLAVYRAPGAAEIAYDLTWVAGQTNRC